MTDILAALRTELSDQSNEQVRISGQRFFKEPVKLYGVKTASVTRIADRHFKELKSLDRLSVLSLCEDLLSSGYMEESFIAARWSYKLNDRAEPADFALFERWVDSYITNWASCDSFCNHTVGGFLEKYPECIGNLLVWAQSGNRWVRRASAVSLIVPAKRGKFLNEAFGIADVLMADREDLVQKGYGWLLKEESRRHPREVFDYVLSNRARMPRTALWYAIELMPPEMRKRAMER